MDYIYVLVNLILQQYFNETRCLIVLTDQGSIFEYFGNEQKIIFSIDSNSTNGTLVNENITTSYHGCQGFVIDSSTSQLVFEEIEKQVRHSLVRFNFRRYLLVIRSNEENIEDVFNTTASTYVTDLLLLVPKTSDTFELWTHNYVGQNEMNSLRLIDVWFGKNSTFLHGYNLYPDKLSNQNGRIIRFACFKYVPYSLCDPTLIPEYYYGTELELAIEFAKHRNMTPEIVYNDNEEEYFGTMFPNWTGTGIMGILLDDRADISFSALYTWEFMYKYVDLSKSYIRTGITCLVPKPKRISGLNTPLLSYSNSLWFAVVGNSIYCMIMLFMVRLYYRKSPKFYGAKIKYITSFLNSMWIIIKISLGQTLSENEKPGFMIIRYILLILFLANLILNSTYFSGLATVMTIPRYESPIDTPSQLATKNIKILGLFIDWVVSIQGIDNENYKKILAKYSIVKETELRDRSKTDQNGFFIERLPFHNYGIDDSMKEDVIENYHLMEEDVYWEYSVFILRKSSVLSSGFDQFVLRVVETGLFYYWQNKAVYYSMDYNVQKVVVQLGAKKMSPPDVIKLKFFHVEGSFAILFTGYFLSTVIFIIEKCLARSRKQMDNIKD